MTRRLERVNCLIRQEISQLLQHQVKDPRLGSLVSVVEVVTSPDLKYAKVFVSCIGGKEKKKETLRVLASASGFLRGEMAKRLSLRYIPELDFQWDDSIEQGAHVLKMIDLVIETENRG